MIYSLFVICVSEQYMNENLKNKIYVFCKMSHKNYIDKFLYIYYILNILYFIKS